MRQFQKNDGNETVSIHAKTTCVVSKKCIAQGAVGPVHVDPLDFNPLSMDCLVKQSMQSRMVMEQSIQSKMVMELN
jgi:hypothetical protein